jgi:phage tail-like protein
MTRHDPYRGFNFRLEIDGLSLGDFSEVALGAAITDVVEYRDGSSPIVRKLPGVTRYANVTLKRGITGSMELYRWHRQVADGQANDARRNVAIILSDESRAPIARFTLRNAWPVRYEAPSFDANANDVAIETLELTHEGLERES